MTFLFIQLAGMLVGGWFGGEIAGKIERAQYWGGFRSGLDLAALVTLPIALFAGGFAQAVAGLIRPRKLPEESKP